MAQRVVVTLSDDIDGGEASETVIFGLDGRSYEIDLNADNAKKLREELGPYVQAGRKRAKSGKAFRRTSVDPDPRAVRAWAESNGMEVPARGRIPKKVYDAFNAAR
ncbi:Lsr2 family protein [Streptomyces sp. AJS327]|uniref:histone-like nucleoid-structuring protein Lsr2 n=1 Tax=Streptomyces sp. AJS327 TaxID=2545265 RepID=UPI0015DF418E|nr:Lsr2 family protein [Streptomyces sp. AJS327]MBA0053582.1 Lsr2 family protein [Streptomyces sp. AJS327]